MELAIHGKQMDVGDSLRSHVTKKLEDINAKFFNRAIDVSVTLSPEGHGFVKSHVSLRVGKDIMVSANAIESDAYASFDSAAEKVAKQLRRYKNRLRDHHANLELTPESEMLKARNYVLATQQLDHTADADQSSDEGDFERGDAPVIVAEESTQIQKMSVHDAVMRMDLSGQTAILFRNPKNNHLNMVYRRADGNIGWIEPQDDVA